MLDMLVPRVFARVAAAVFGQVEYKKRKSFYEKTDWAAVEGLFAQPSASPVQKLAQLADGAS